METLQFDLNELVSKEVNARIENLEKTITELQERNSELYQKNKDLEVKVKEAKLPIALITHLRNEFSKIESDPREKNDYHKYKAQKRFEFISELMKNIFGINKEQNGWLSTRGDGNLYHYLAVNYYQNKEVLLSILPLLVDDQYSASGIQFIKHFVMPYDWKKQDVLAFIKDPGSCTNSSYMGISNFWIERRAGKNNCPYDLVMRNQFFINEDVFELMLTQLKRSFSNATYFYAVYNYHNLTDDQINKMGYALMSNYKATKDYENIKGFLTNNLMRFNDELLEFFYQYADDNNEYRALFWQKFPVRYQHKFLLSKSIEDVLKITTSYNCKWSSEEKAEFFKMYSNQPKSNPVG